MRIACVLIQSLPIQVALTDDHTLRGQPVVIGGLPFEPKAVYDASPAAMACGIKLGMSLHEAYALCPEAKFLPSDERRYEEIFRKVVNILERFSPVVDVQELGCTYLDVTGVHNEPNLAFEILASMSSEIRLSACVGISNGKFFSRVAALTSKPEAPVLISQSGENEFIAPFSIDFLPCSDATKERLNLLGIRFIGHLAEYSKEALVAQFGSEGVVMHELAHGIDRSPLIPRAKPEVIADSVELDSPATSFIEILQTSEVILDRLLDTVNPQGKLCREVLIRLSFTSGTSEERRFPLKQPTNSRAVILSSLQTWLGAVRFPGPAVEVHLSLSLTREQGKKLSLWPEQKRVKQELITAANELKLRFGYQPIKKAQLVNPEPILPERRFRLTEVLE